MDSATLIGNVVGLVLLIGAAVWVFLDAVAIGSDRGQAPSIVNTKAGAWAFGVLLFLAAVLPAYLLVRLRYKRLLVERKAEAGFPPQPDPESAAAAAGVWPPPPSRPTGP